MKLCYIELSEPYAVQRPTVFRFLKFGNIYHKNIRIGAT